MGIFSTSEETKIKLVEIKNGSIILSITKQAFDGPYPFGDPFINKIIIKQGEERII